MEIERKFRVTKLPEHLEHYPKKVIRQGYLCAGPIVRIRQSNDKYILTYKNKIGLKQEDAIVSQELEAELTRDAFEHLLEKIDHYVVEKTRYLIPYHNEYTIELDIFSGRLLGLAFAEVEFKSPEQAAAFEKPEWFGEDVSFDYRFHNSYLSTVEKYTDF